jgi:hypothetical protein
MGALKRISALARRLRAESDPEGVLRDVVSLACEVTEARYGALAIF